MPIFKTLTLDLFEEPSASLQEGSPVKTSARRGKARGSSKAKGQASGSSTLELFESADLPFASLRTYLASELSERTGFCKTWKQQATPLKRSWWVLTTSGQVTEESASGSWRTPDAGLSKARATPNTTADRIARGKQISIESQAQQWPTPTLHGNHNRAGLSPTSGDGLSTKVKQWPTPRTADGMTHNLRSLENIQGNGRGRLEDVVALTFRPDPQETGQTSPQSSGRLNPAFVCWLQGYPEDWFDGVEMPVKERRSSKG